MPLCNGYLTFNAFCYATPINSFHPKKKKEKKRITSNWNHLHINRKVVLKMADDTSCKPLMPVRIFYTQTGREVQIGCNRTHDAIDLHRLIFSLSQSFYTCPLGPRSCHVPDQREETERNPRVMPTEESSVSTSRSRKRPLVFLVPRATDISCPVYKDKRGNKSKFLFLVPCLAVTAIS